MDLINEILKIAAGAIIVKKHVEPDIAKFRMDICIECPRHNVAENKCTECGCFLDLKTNAYSNWRPAKNRVEITHCPLAKWGDIEIVNAYRQTDGLPLLET